MRQWCISVCSVSTWNAPSKTILNNKKADTIKLTHMVLLFQCIGVYDCNKMKRTSICTNIMVFIYSRRLFVKLVKLSIRPLIFLYLLHSTKSSKRLLNVIKLIYLFFFVNIHFKFPFIFLSYTLLLE